MRRIKNKNGKKKPNPRIPKIKEVNKPDDIEIESAERQILNYRLKWADMGESRLESIIATGEAMQEIRGIITKMRKEGKTLEPEDHARLMFNLRMSAHQHGANIDSAVKAGFYDPKDTQLNILQERDKMIENLAKLDKEISEDETEVILLEDNSNG